MQSIARVFRQGSLSTGVRNRFVAPTLAIHVRSFAGDRGFKEHEMAAEKEYITRLERIPSLLSSVRACESPPPPVQTEDDTQVSVVRLPNKKDREEAQKFAIFIQNVFSPSECAAIIKNTERRKYLPALVNVGGGRQKRMDEVRNNERCMVDDDDFAAEIFRRLKPVIPAVFPLPHQRRHQTDASYEAVGLNERLRFLRYDKGEYFRPHQDGSYQRRDDTCEISKVTVQLYLNEGFRGGCTTFIDGHTGDRSEVVPRTGSVLLFQHDINHEGSLLEKGRKYALRTDVMYRPVQQQTVSRKQRFNGAF